MLVNFAKDKFSAQKAYCLGELGNEYDQGLIAFFEQNFDGEVIKDSFPTNTSDFTTYLNKAVAEDVDVIFCPVSIAYATQIVGLAASMGLDIPCWLRHTGQQRGAGGRAGQQRTAVRVHLLPGGRLSQVR